MVIPVTFLNNNLADGVFSQVEEKVYFKLRREEGRESYEATKAALFGDSSFEEDAIAAIQNLDAVKLGLLSVSDASQTVRNFLKTGFSLKQSIALTQKFADAAAFGKTASLSFGEAVRSASEDVATQSSALLNNISIVTNLSTFLEREGLTLDDLTSKTDGAAAIQVLNKGLRIVRLEGSKSFWKKVSGAGVVAGFVLGMLVTR